MRLVSFDTETWPFRPGNMTPPIVCGVFCETLEPEPLCDVMLRDDALDYLETLLDDPQVELCGAFMAYDMACAGAARPHLLPKIFAAYDAGRIFCTHVAQALLDIFDDQLFRDRDTGALFGKGDEGGRYTLEYLVRHYLKKDISASKKAPDAWRTRYWQLEGVPVDQWPVEAYNYVFDDGWETLAVVRAQKAIGNNLHCMREKAAADFALHLSSCWGIRTDPVLVDTVVSEIEQHHRDTIARFQQVGFYRSNFTKDMAKIKSYVAQVYGGFYCPSCGGKKEVQQGTGKAAVMVACPVCRGGGNLLDTVPTTDKGDVSTSADTCKNSGDELLQEWAEAGPNEKLYSTYVKILRQGVTTPINPQFNVLVNTGRTSCKNPNLQNQPRKGVIRECFVPRPRNVLVSVDYHMLEMVTLAQNFIWMLGQSSMADSINAGNDLHLDMASRVLGLSYEETKRLHKAGDKQVDNARQAMKPINFGLPGGLGSEQLVIFARQNYKTHFCELAGAPQCGVEKMMTRSGVPICSECYRLASQYREQWFERWSEAEDYFKIIAGLTERPEGHVQVLGPAGNLGLIRGGCSFTAGANCPFQGLAARGATHALFNVSRECYCAPQSPLYCTRPLIFIHDEILGAIPLTTAEGVHASAMRMAEIMVQTMRYYCPDIRVKAEPALMLRWLKGAEAALDAQGNLLPIGKCPVCGGLGAVGWDGVFQVHRHGTVKGQSCAGAQVVGTDRITLGLLA